MCTCHCCANRRPAPKTAAQEKAPCPQARPREFWPPFVRRTPEKVSRR